MFASATPAAVPSLAMSTGGGTTAGEKSPISEGFAALLALGSDEDGAVTSSQAGLPDALALAATGKVDGKILPPALPVDLAGESTASGAAQTDAPAAFEVPESGDPVDSDSMPATGIVSFVSADVVAIPVPLAIRVQPAGSRPPVNEPGKRNYLANISRPSSLLATPPLTQAATAVSPASVIAAPTPVDSGPASASPITAQGQTVAVAPQEARVSLRSATSPLPEAPPANAGARVNSIPPAAAPLLAVSVQVAARLAIPARSAPTAPVKTGAAVIADEPPAISPAAIAAPNVLPATTPAPMVARSVELSGEGPDPALLSPAADHPVAEAPVAAAPAPPQLVVSSDALAASQPTTPAATTANPSAAPAPHDFAGLVERLVEARDAAAPQAVHTTLHHAEFGRVALAFNTDQGALSVQMASADPAFAPAVAAAAQAGMNADSGQNQNSNQPTRHDGQSQPSSSAQTGSAQNGSGQSQPGARETREPPAARRDDARETTEPREAAQSRDDSDIYA